MNEPTELSVRRLVLRDDAGRERAVLETVPPTDSDPPNAPGVRLTLLAATGDPMLTAELNRDGEPRLSVGHLDRGTTVILNRREVALWTGGNEVAVLSGGRLRLCNSDGSPVTVFPEPPEESPCPVIRFLTARAIPSSANLGCAYR